MPNKALHRMPGLRFRRVHGFGVPASVSLVFANMIALDLQTFQQSHGSDGNVTGVIYVELESGAFPGTGWSDFPVIILNWWAEALLELGIRTRREVLWRFMDGPYCLTLTKVTGTVPRGALTLGQIESSLAQAAQRTVEYCEQQQLFCGDLAALRENVQRLKANQAVQRTGASRSAHIEIRPSVAAGSRR